MQTDRYAHLWVVGHHVPASGIHSHALRCRLSSTRPANEVPAAATPQRRRRRRSRSRHAGPASGGQRGTLRGSRWRLEGGHSVVMRLPGSSSRRCAWRRGACRCRHVPRQGCGTRRTGRGGSCWGGRHHRPPANGAVLLALQPGAEAVQVEHMVAAQLLVAACGRRGQSATISASL